MSARQTPNGGTFERGGRRGLRARLRASGLCACCALLLLGLWPAAASAYTIIMRGGRRVEAPDSFAVTRTTLTYEAAPGVNVTLQLSQIDIAATERANGEPPGSLLRRNAATGPQTRASQATGTRLSARTLTNRELEPVRRARLESERAYEQRRKELGLPTAEEERRRSADESRALRALAQRHAATQMQAESYWRERAAALRGEELYLDAEIAYLRDSLGVPPAYNISYAVGRIDLIFDPFISADPSAFVTRQSFGTRTQLNGRINFGGGMTRGRLSFNRQTTRDSFQRRSFGRPGFFGRPVAVLAVPFDYATADATALHLRLIELEAARAGLAARWQQLEDEARRAGALPGWLRQ